MDEGKLLTEAELLQALNINLERTTLWHWRKAGMPHVKVGRSIRYDLAAVQNWLALRQVDDQRIEAAARKVVALEGLDAIKQWKPTELDRLNTKLEAAILAECPDLGPGYRFRVGSAIQAEKGGPWRINIAIERVDRVGEISLTVLEEGEE